MHNSKLHPHWFVNERSEVRNNSISENNGTPYWKKMLRLQPYCTVHTQYNRAVLSCARGLNNIERLFGPIIPSARHIETVNPALEKWLTFCILVVFFFLLSLLFFLLSLLKTNARPYNNKLYIISSPALGNLI